MSTFTVTLPNLSILDRAVDAAGAFFAGIDRTLAAKRTFDCLSAMTDAQLARRGLTRADISVHVFKRLDG